MSNLTDISLSPKASTTRSLDLIDAKISNAEQKRDFYEQMYLKKMNKNLDFQDEKEMFLAYSKEVLSVRKEKELVFANQSLVASLAQADLRYQFPLAKTPSETSSVFSYGWEIKQNALEYYGNVVQPNNMLKCQLTRLVKPKKDVACLPTHEKLLLFDKFE